MRWLIRRSLRGRRAQVVALAVTMGFSSVLVATLGVLTETGVRGQVTTGEYNAAPVLVGTAQTRPVDGDVDVAVPGRALVRASVADEIREALPDARVVADVIVPAVIGAGNDETSPIEVHPWSAMELGDRDLVSGRAPDGEGEIVLSRGTIDSEQLGVGDIVDVGFGDTAAPQLVVGVIDADDSGTDVADAYLADSDERLRDASADHVAALGVWPADADDEEVIAEIAASGGAQLWSADDRGAIEVVQQGQAKADLVSASAASGAMGIIVSVFTLVAITSLQIRERARELGTLRVVGATPRQIKRLLLGEIRTVSLCAGVAGALAAPVVAAGLFGLLQVWNAVPRGLDLVLSPLPLATATTVAVVSADIAARVAVRRVVRASPLTGLQGFDEQAMRAPRILLGVLGVGLGIFMACGPLYASGDAAQGLSGLSGLVIAISLGPLSPLIVRLACWTLRRRTGRSASRHLAVASLHARSARVGGALTPIVLGVTLSFTQLFSGSTLETIAADQVDAGHNGDLIVTGPMTEVGDELAADLATIPEVASVQSVVTTDVLIRGNADEAEWHPVPALAVGENRIERYADLAPVATEEVNLTDDGVALSTQKADALGAAVGDQIEVVLPNGGEVERRVTGFYLWGPGFGDAVLPIEDLEPATASGRPNTLAVTAAPDSSVPDTEQQVEEHLAGRPGLEIAAPGEATMTEETGAAFSVLLLLILWGYIAIAAVNSLVITTLAREREFAILRVIGATPTQQRRTTRWEAIYLASIACLVATVASAPGLSGLMFELSHGERIIPSIDITIYAVIVATGFALVVAAIQLPMRRVTRGWR